VGGWVLRIWCRCVRAVCGCLYVGGWVGGGGGRGGGGCYASATGVCVSMCEGVCMCGCERVFW